MSNKFDEPWSTRETIELLVNILQGQYPDLVGHLVHHVRESRITPQWPGIALPEGRSLRASQMMFDRLLSDHRVQQPFAFGPTSTSPYLHHPQQTRVFTEPIQSQAIPRAIQPRPMRSTDSPAPASTNGETLTIVRTAGPESGAEKKKKRGRPTKEEVEERDRLLAAEGKVYEPKKRPSKKFRPSTGTPIPAEDVTHEPALQERTPSRLIEATEDSSSGKRKLRSQESHSAPQTSIHTSSPRATSRIDPDKPAESPSDRFMARFGDRSSDRVSSGGEPSSSLFSPPSTSKGA